jgi:hypothetical protein
MAIGFPACHEETVRFKGVPRTKLRRVAEDAFDDLGWTWRRDHRPRLVANVPIGAVMIFPLFITWGERVIVEIDEGELIVRSEGAIPLAWLDFGKNQANVDKFLRRVEDFLEA